MNELNQKLADIYESFAPRLGVNVAVQIGVLDGTDILTQAKFGPDYKFFDLASLTKIIFMVPLMADMVERELIRWEDSVQDYWPEFPHEVTLLQLISHQSGFAAEFPFYESLNGSEQERWQQLEKLLIEQKQECPAGSRFLYSDIGVLTLSVLATKVTRKSLIELWDDLSRGGHPDMRFAHDLPTDMVAPTEECNFRGQLVRGEVHDENCWALGGVTLHAGLFSSLEAMLDWSLKMRGLYFSGGVFTQMTEKIEGGDWGLGVMKPTPGSASCGDRFSANSFGHTGFTGTSYWYDPDVDLSVVILTNRVHPRRENKTIVELRPLIHNVVYECRS